MMCYCLDDVCVCLVCIVLDNVEGNIWYTMLQQMQALVHGIGWVPM